MFFFFQDLLVALLVAVVLTTLFIAGFRRKVPWTRPWASYLFFFVIVLLASWGGGVWVTPGGLTLGDVYWLPFFLVGLIFALFITAAVLAVPPRSGSEAKRQVQRERYVELVFGIFFWALVVTLGVLIGAHYVFG